MKEEAIFKQNVNAAETNEGKLPFRNFFIVVTVEGSFVCGWLGRVLLGVETSPCASQATLT